MGFTNIKLSSQKSYIKDFIQKTYTKVPSEQVQNEES